MYDFEDKDFQNEYKEYLKKKKDADKKVIQEEKAAAQKIKDAMTTEEKIKFVNTPVENMPKNLQVGMVKNPQAYNFVRMSKPHIGRQKETLAARLIKYMEKYSLTTETFCDICNEYAAKYDIPATKTQRGYRTRLFPRSVDGYLNYNICPKIDKLTIMAEAMGVGIDYFAGYGSDNRQSKNPVLESRFRKRKHKGDDVA